MLNALTGPKDYLLDYLLRNIEKAENIRFNVSFLMETGIKAILPALKEASEKGTPIKILTTRYMGITEPAAIYLLLDQLGEQVDIRFYADNHRSFHPKAYIFDYLDDGEIFVGSSNLSLSALTLGVEWNLRLTKSQSFDDYHKFSETFNQLFSQESIPVTDKILREYASSWKQRAHIDESQDYLSPRGAQIEALYELKKARNEGVHKGLVIAATGTGKTYLAAFDSKNYRRILFLAHREEILKQAQASFKNVRPEASTGMYYGKEKDDSADIYFATVQTLSREDNLHRFRSTYFDYIIVDEFHHAAADSYKVILEHFNPKFLLGLTATPYRMDNRDIFALCEDNVIYEIYLKDAINRGMLVPFKYYGVYDETDYDNITYRNGKYLVPELEANLINPMRASLILEKYQLLARQRSLAFCVSIKHAEFMAEYFSIGGIPSVAVHSGTQNNPYTMNRERAINSLIAGEIEVIFAVDIFNEGVDIPSIDTVMFLRPTDSYVVFLQQLGRGLRKDNGKEYLTVLDFIGNYKRAHYIPALLAGDNPMHQKKTNPLDISYPNNCQVQYDFKLLDLFREMTKRDPLPKRMREEYYRLKEELQRRPKRIDIYEGSDIPIREFSKHGWIRFLATNNELTALEQTWLDTPVEEFLKYLEKTRMSKLYKLPTIAALIEGQKTNKEVSLEKVGEKFMLFYTQNPLHQRDLRDKSNKNWRSWTTSHFTDLARKNPVHFLSKSKFFNYDEIKQVFSMADELIPYLCPELTEHTLDILEYKRLSYFRHRFREDD